MLVSNFFVLAGATLATAVPAEEAAKTKTVRQFAVTKFVYGCTSDCPWSFLLAVEGAGPNHPPVKKPVECSGNLDATDYIECDYVSDTQTLSAYITPDGKTLKLQYKVQTPEEQATDYYTGQTKVYVATGPNAKLQKANFKVKESGATGVA